MRAPRRPPRTINAMLAPISLKLSFCTAPTFPMSSFTGSGRLRWYTKPSADAAPRPTKFVACDGTQKPRRAKTPRSPLALRKCFTSGACIICRTPGGKYPATYFMNNLLGESPSSRNRLACCLFRIASSFLETMRVMIQRFADSTRSSAASSFAYFRRSLVDALKTCSLVESSAMPKVRYMRSHSRWLRRSEAGTDLANHGKIRCTIGDDSIVVAAATRWRPPAGCSSAIMSSRSGRLLVPQSKFEASQAVARGGAQAGRCPWATTGSSTTNGSARSKIATAANVAIVNKTATSGAGLRLADLRDQCRGDPRT
mmetsp:Transcript_31632/g.87314  ORF Transcript_31632/g.87314 Transcript_31632/m.87314 type:complete len:313 (-) Transcript_31632:89-1027(-)